MTNLKKYKIVQNMSVNVWSQGHVRSDLFCGGE